MDVGRALADRVEHDLVDEADDRRVLDVVAPAVRVRPVIGVRGHVEVLEVEVLVAPAQRGHLRVDLLDRLLHRALELVVLDDDGLDRQAGLELDLVDRVQDGRVRDADVQALAALDQRQHAVLRQQLLVDEPDDVDVGRDRVEVQERHAEFLGRGDGDVAGGGHVVGHEPADQVGLALARARDRVQHGRFLDQAVEHEPLREACQDPPDRARRCCAIVQIPAPDNALPLSL